MAFVKRAGKALGISFILIAIIGGAFYLVNVYPLFIVLILYGYYLYRIYDSIGE